jgi:hypothetical protein
MEQMPVELEIGWRDMDAGVSRLKRILHGVDDASFSSQEYIHLYTYVRFHLFFTAPFRVMISLIRYQNPI